MPGPEARTFGVEGGGRLLSYEQAETALAGVTAHTVARQEVAESKVKNFAKKSGVLTRFGLATGLFFGSVAVGCAKTPEDQAKVKEAVAASQVHEGGSNFYKVSDQVRDDGRFEVSYRVGDDQQHVWRHYAVGAETLQALEEIAGETGKPEVIKVKILSKIHQQGESLDQR